MAVRWLVLPTVAVTFVAGTQTLQKYLLLHLWSETYRSAYELTASAAACDLTTS